MRWQVIFGSHPVNVRVYVDSDTEDAAKAAALLVLTQEAPGMLDWCQVEQQKGMIVAVNITPLHQRGKDDLNRNYGKMGQPRPPGTKGDDFQLTDDAK